MAFKNAKSEPHELMTIFIETLTGATFEIKVSPQDRVKSIKSKIYRVEGIPVSQQHLLFNNRELPDSASVSEPGIALRDRATLKLVLSMRGGPISLVHQPMPLTRSLIKNLVRLNRETLAEETPRMAVLVLRIGDQLNLLHVVEDEDQDSSGNSSDDVTSSEFEKAENPNIIEENSVTLGKVCDLKERMEKLSLQRKTRKTGNQSTELQPLADTRVDETNEVFAFPSRKLPSLNSKLEGVTLKSRSDFSKVPILPDILPLESTSRDFDLSLEEESSPTMSELIRPKTSPASLHESQFYDLYEDEDFQNSLQIAQPQFRSCVSACATDHEWRGGKAFLQSLQSLSVLPPIDHAPSIAEDHRKVADDRGNKYEANSISSLEQINLHHGRCNPIKYNSTMRVEPRPELGRRSSQARSYPEASKTSLPVESQDLQSVTSSQIAQWAASPAALNFQDVSAIGEQSAIDLPRGLASLSSKRPRHVDRLQTWTETPYWSMSDETKDYSKSNLSELPETGGRDSEKKNRLRCAKCKKRLSLANNFECRCGLTFCSYHRYAETHHCTYDFKKESRKLLELANPAVITPKLPKI